jgi:hypothetical protein
VQLRTIKAVPRADGSDAPLLAWFEDPSAFGDGFVAMRRAMARSLAAFVEETEAVTSVPRSPEARTRTFLQHMTPGQGTLIGTSALRLDKASAWLRGDGVEPYFRMANGRAPTLDEACRFADAIFLEILGTYRRPAAAASYISYVAAAFMDAENRTAADRGFRTAVASMGKLWGTLLALRGYTEGESFVARNVGLKAAWANGTWRAQIVFMDHEHTHLTGARHREFHPENALPGMFNDWRHIFGSEPGRRPRLGSLAVLADIYRVDAALAAEARAAIVEEMRRAYRVTLERLRDDPDLRARFRSSFLDSLLAWDAVVGLYRASRVGARERSQWKGRMRRLMRAYHLEEPLIQEYRRAIRRHGRLLRRYQYLFDADDGA